MKTIAKKRIIKEIEKRSFLTLNEKKKLIFSFLQFSTMEPSTEFWANAKIFKKQNFARKSHCRSHCFISGRGRSVYKHFRLSRHMVRELTHRGQIYGLLKASWLQFKKIILNFF